MTKQENGSSIPESWKWTTVGEIYDVVGGGTPSTGKPEYWNGDIPWITSADIVGLNNISPRKYITRSGVQNSATNMVPEKSIIVVTRVGLGKLGIAKTKICFSQDCHALIGNNSLVAPEYSLYYLSTAVKEFKYKNRGTTISGVTKKQLCQLPFPLPPFNEQMRIFSKVEELFSFLDAGTESLRKVQAQLKRYRQAVLKHAFEGKLTEEWRKNHKAQTNPVKNLQGKTEGDMKVRRDVPENVEMPEDLKQITLPESWGLFSVAYLLRTGVFVDVKDGNHGSNHPKGEDFTNDGLPFITASQVMDFEIDYTNAPKLKGKPLEKLKVGFSHPGDVVLSHKGTVGRVSVCKQECILSPQTTYYRVHEDMVDRNFLAYFFASPIFQDQLASVKSQTTRDFVSISKQYTMFVVVPSILEQKEIVKELENRLQIFRGAKKSIVENLLRSQRLRQSILKSAFEGGLVSQNPNDEPVEQLLERIRIDHRQPKAEGSGVYDHKKPKVDEQAELSSYVK